MTDEELEEAIKTNSLWENILNLGSINFDEYIIYHQVVRKITNQNFENLNKKFGSSKLDNSSINDQLQICLNYIFSKSSVYNVLSLVFVDTVGKPEKYQDKLLRFFPQLSIKVESKADATYPIVGAASIVAKVARDKLVHNWDHVEPSVDKSIEVGSGYPGDPKTKNWIRQHLDHIFGVGLTSFSYLLLLILLEKVEPRKTSIIRKTFLGHS